MIVRSLRTLFIAYGCLAANFAPGADSPSPVVRTPLLTATIDGSKLIDRVEIKQIEMATPMASGAHVHPCPVVGQILEGQILFQLEGESQQTLVAGSAFFEPANAKVLHFDNIGPGKAKFVAYYLLGKDDHELIRMLNPR